MCRFSRPDSTFLIHSTGWEACLNINGEVKHCKSVPNGAGHNDAASPTSATEGKDLILEQVFRDARYSMSQGGVYAWS